MESGVVSFCFSLSVGVRIRPEGWTYAVEIADNLSKAGWSWGWVSALNREGQTIWIVDARSGDKERFVVRADEKLTAFVELQSAIHEFAVSLIV